MRNVGLVVGLVVVLVSAAGLFAADVNILVVGSTHSFDEGKESRGAMDSNATTEQLREILARDPKIGGKATVVFEEIFRSKAIDTAIGGAGKMMPMEYRCYSLAQWFFWPEGRDKRLANLRGEGVTKWDFVVLVGDPYVMANMPGVYAEGVNLISDEVRKGTAKPVLMMPQTKSGLIRDVVYRVGRGTGIPVAPSGLADKTKKQYGAFEFANPFAMKYVTKRNVTYNHTGTSSENGIKGALEAAIKRCGVGVRKTGPKEGQPKIDFNYGRANSIFEKQKQYKVAPDRFHRSYGFPMQDQSKTAATTMLYGIDKRFHERRYDDGTDLGIAYDMIRQGEVPKDIRCVPIRLMWAKLHDADPDIKPLRDRWHMSRYLDEASGTFMYTLLSGRCPIGKEPPKENQDARRRWLGQKIGYETAWRMSHLTARVPGFSVRPSSNTATVSPASPAELTVRFQYPPIAKVTVAVSIDPPAAASASPGTLTFTPQNHATPQKVTVTGGKVSADKSFRVEYATKSSDEVFSGLCDSWEYKATVK